jgi:predicted NUDIX family phosphoesterase
MYGSKIIKNSKIGKIEQEIKHIVDHSEKEKEQLTINLIKREQMRSYFTKLFTYNRPRTNILIGLLASLI